MKVKGSDVHTSVYDKRDDFQIGFPIVSFSWLSGDVPRLPSYAIYISQFVRFARRCTSVLDFHSKNLQITSKRPSHRVTDIINFEKHLESSWGHTLTFFPNLAQYGSKNMFPKENLANVYSYLVYKLKRIKGAVNFVSSNSNIVKRIRRRKYDPVIIERTLVLYLALLEPCADPRALHSDKQGGGDYMTWLVQTSEETRSRSSFPLYVSRDSFSPWTRARFQMGGA